MKWGGGENVQRYTMYNHNPLTKSTKQIRTPMSFIFRRVPRRLFVPSRQIVRNVAPMCIPRFSNVRWFTTSNADDASGDASNRTPVMKLNTDKQRMTLLFTCGQCDTRAGKMALNVANCSEAREQRVDDVRRPQRAPQKLTHCTAKTFSRQAYERGAVLIQCPGW